MLQKIKKYGIFFLYSWCIYQTYFFIGAAMSLYDAGTHINLFYIWQILIAFFGVQHIIFILENFDLAIKLVLYGTLPLILMVLIYIMVLTVWFTKQTILRAWLLALTGMFLGTGLMYWLVFPPDEEIYIGIIPVVGVNILYPCLYIGNYLQKKFWPQNRVANKIRAILKWPCLRT